MSNSYVYNQFHRLGLGALKQFEVLLQHHCASNHDLVLFTLTDNDYDFWLHPKHENSNELVSHVEPNGVKEAFVAVSVVKIKGYSITPVETYSFYNFEDNIVTLEVERAFNHLIPLSLFSNETVREMGQAEDFFTKFTEIIRFTSSDFKESSSFSKPFNGAFKESFKESFDLKIPFSKLLGYLSPEIPSEDFMDMVTKVNTIRHHEPSWWAGNLWQFGYKIERDPEVENLEEEHPEFAKIVNQVGNPFSLPAMQDNSEMPSSYENLADFLAQRNTYAEFNPFLSNFRHSPYFLVIFNWFNQFYNNDSEYCEVYNLPANYAEIAGYQELCQVQSLYDKFAVSYDLAPDSLQNEHLFNLYAQTEVEVDKLTQEPAKNKLLQVIDQLRYVMANSDLSLGFAEFMGATIGVSLNRILHPEHQIKVNDNYVHALRFAQYDNLATCLLALRFDVEKYLTLDQCQQEIKRFSKLTSLSPELEVEFSQLVYAVLVNYWLALVSQRQALESNRELGEASELQQRVNYYLKRSINWIAANTNKANSEVELPHANLVFANAEKTLAEHLKSLRTPDGDSLFPALFAGRLYFHEDFDWYNNQVSLLPARSYLRYSKPRVYKNFPVLDYWRQKLDSNPGLGQFYKSLFNETYDYWKDILDIDHGGDIFMWFNPNLAVTAPDFAKDTLMISPTDNSLLTSQYRLNNIRVISDSSELYLRNNYTKFQVHPEAIRNLSVENWGVSYLVSKGGYAHEVVLPWNLIYNVTFNAIDADHVNISHFIYRNVSIPSPQLAFAFNTGVLNVLRATEYLMGVKEILDIYTLDKIGLVPSVSLSSDKVNKVNKKDLANKSKVKAEDREVNSSTSKTSKATKIKEAETSEAKAKEAKVKEEKAKEAKLKEPKSKEVKNKEVKAKEPKAVSKKSTSAKLKPSSSKSSTKVTKPATKKSTKAKEKAVLFKII